MRNHAFVHLSSFLIWKSENSQVSREESVLLRIDTHPNRNGMGSTFLKSFLLILIQRVGIFPFHVTTKHFN
jgi:hypothetical protein